MVGFNNIFNALVEKIEILTPTHFVFELKSGLRVEEILESHKPDKFHRLY